MTNPKDPPLGTCGSCNNQIFYDELHECQVEEKHFPGCHKVHIECANKKIEEAIAIISGVSNCCDCRPIESRKWLESLEVEE